MKIRIELTIEKKLYDTYKGKYNMSKLFNELLKLHNYTNNIDMNKAQLLLNNPEWIEFNNFKDALTFLFELAEKKED